MTASRPRLIAWTAAAALCGIGLLVIARLRDKPGGIAGADGIPPAAGARATGGTPASRLDGLLESWLAGGPAKAEPARLKQALLAVPPDEAAAAILAFLRGGRDCPTGLEFQIGSGGNLASSPTLRTLLLDLLFSISPAAAAEISHEILRQPTSADEWALALRNLGRGARTPESDAFLAAKTVELIRHPAWQADPSVGYLNAFDVLVHTEALATAPLLASFVGNRDRKDLAHAAFLTLDRLVQRRPREMLAFVAADAALQQGRPEMTAQQMARADLRDPAQRDIVGRWLRDPARRPTHLHAFAAVFPNHNQFVSHNLLSSDVGPSGTALAAHDREVLPILESWSADPGFSTVREHLEVMTARLRGFIRRGRPSGQ